MTEPTRFPQVLTSLDRGGAEAVVMAPGTGVQVGNGSVVPMVGPIKCQLIGNHSFGYAVIVTTNLRRQRNHASY